MRDQDQIRKLPPYAVVLSAFSIIGAFMAVFVKGGEFASSSMVWISLGFDAAIAIVMVPLLIMVWDIEESSFLRSLALFLGPFGFIGALVQVAARFSSNHGWWTGHFFR